MTNKSKAALLVRVFAETGQRHQISPEEALLAITLIADFVAAELNGLTWTQLLLLDEIRATDPKGN